MSAAAAHVDATSSGKKVIAAETLTEWTKAQTAQCRLAKGHTTVLPLWHRVESARVERSAGKGGQETSELNSSRH